MIFICLLMVLSSTFVLWSWFKCFACSNRVLCDEIHHFFLSTKVSNIIQTLVNWSKLNSFGLFQIHCLVTFCDRYHILISFSQLNFFRAYYLMKLTKYEFPWHWITRSFLFDFHYFRKLTKQITINHQYRTCIQNSTKSNIGK